VRPNLSVIPAPRERVRSRGNRQEPRCGFSELSLSMETSAATPACEVTHAAQMDAHLGPGPLPHALSACGAGMTAELSVRVCN
jgi:hypothetical protein